MPDKILVTRSSMPDFEEYAEEIRPIWESHWLTNMGVKHRQLEADLLSYLKVPQIALFVNGHSALECVLEAMGLKGKVVTTPYTFASTTHAIVRKGLVIVSLIVILCCIVAIVMKQTATGAVITPDITALTDEAYIATAALLHL